jgi:hypothetical protein
MTEAVNGATNSKSDTSTKSAPFAETSTVSVATACGGALHRNSVSLTTDAGAVWPPKRHNQEAGKNAPRMAIAQPPVEGHCWGVTLSTSIVAW